MPTNNAKWRPRLPWALRHHVKQAAAANGQGLDYKTAELIRKGLGASVPPDPGSPRAVTDGALAGSPDSATDRASGESGTV